MSQPLTPELMAAARIKPVASLEKLIKTPLDKDTSVLLYRRKLPPELNFDGLAEEMAPKIRDIPADYPSKYITALWKTIIDVRSWEHEAEAAFIREDMQAFAAHDDPAFRLVLAELYKKFSERGDPSVYQFHEDGYIPKGRILTCYNAPTTEGLVREDAEKVGMTPANSPLYEARPGARIFHFEPGDIWKHATHEVAAPGFIHRAKEITYKALPRLLVSCP